MSTKNKYYLLFALFFVMAIVVAIYFSPYLLDRPDILVGFALCFSLILIGLLLLLLISYLSKDGMVKPSLEWVVVLLAFIFIGLFSTFLIQRSKQRKKDFDRQALITSMQKKELISAEKNTALLPLWLEIKAKLLTEIAKADASLPDILIEEIVELSHSYIPYESYIAKRYIISSPERGRLLLDLLKLDIDSYSWSKILAQATFAYSSLPQANLEGRDLNGINLSSANLMGAKLVATRFYKANLRNVNLWSADLSRAKLSDTQLTNANLEWTQLIEANLDNAHLDGATLNNSTATKASFVYASVQQARLIAARLDSCNLHGVDFYQSELSKCSMKAATLTAANLRNSFWTDAILTKADMTNSVLRGTSLERADLTAVTLDSVFVRGADWYEKLLTWQVKGRTAITKKYHLLEETSFPENFVLHRH